ncbi:hypothetical protein DM02DRAFT_634871 [Periconia macrospinosa]|uniref:Uncharacterized protein n=1 Tax=Periconia macrospinosa TaxID=97972 RepID=A0A2V1D4Y6_9PLEO|nr:hypothetical protein DM02DRAFT_634871 [Periconia macrospinosa]
MSTSTTIGDHLFQKLASINVQRIISHSQSISTFPILLPLSQTPLTSPPQGTIFAGSIHRSNLTLTPQPPTTQTSSTETICFLASSADLTVCYNDAARFFGYRHVVIVQELDSASSQTQTANLDFAAATILNSPLTAIAQIDRMIGALSYAAGKPVYIGLALPVAGLVVGGGGQGNGNGSGNGNGRAERQKVVVGREEEEMAEAALAMSMLR